MARVFRSCSACCLVAALLLSAVAVVPAFAASTDFNKTTAGTYNSNTSGNWDNGVPTNNGLDDNFTMSFSGAILVTNFLSAGGGSLNYARLFTSGSGTLTVISSAGFDSDFGLQLRANDTLTIAGTSTISHGNNSFDNTGGTLILSNGVSTFVNLGSGNTVHNAGTIQITSGANQTTGLNYGQSANFYNDNGSTIVSAGTGTNKFVGTFGAANQEFVNNGTMLINSGVMIVDPRDAHTIAFSNSANGFIQVNSSATFGVMRTTGAWGGGDVPVSLGEIRMNGGTMTMYDFGAANTQNMTRVFKNGGLIDGSGTLAFQVQNAGTIVASNGTLAVTNVSGNAGTWMAKNTGTLEFLTSVDLGAGTIQITGNTLAQGRGSGSLQNTVTLSTSFLNNDGTLLLNDGSGNGGTISMANTGAGGSTDGVQFTNAVNGVMAGRGTFNFGFGSGQANAGFVNNGSILASQGGAGSLTLNVGDSLNKPFSNSSTGYLIISNGTTFGIQRTATQWNAGTLDSQRVLNAGTILLNNGTFVTKDASGASANYLVINSGTVLAQGAGANVNTWRAGMENRGTIYVTNDTAVFSDIGTVQLTNTATGQIILGANGANGTMQATNIGRLYNLGTISGQGTLTLGVDANGQNASLPNSGVIVATNYGAAAQGTFTVNTGNAFSNGGLLNNAGGTILVGTNTTFVFNRTLNAWTNTGATAVRVFSNQGTVFMQGGTFTTSADGVVDTTPTRTNINSGLITGWGTYKLMVTNEGGSILADARGLVNRQTGTLTAWLTSFTNNNGATLGAIGTNSVLLLAINNNALINNGTIQLSAGSIVLSNTLTGTTGGTITNFNAIAGVGDVSTFPIVQSGSGASLIAKTPTDGLTALIATVNPLNTSTLAALTNAELRLTVSGGNAILNQGRMQIDGGSITINGASGTISNDVGGLFYGQGTNNNPIVTSDITSTILASNGVLQVGLGNNSNIGSLEAFGSTDTLRLTNSVLVNAGTMKANAGTVDVATGGIITNSGTIVGAGVYDSSLVNAAGGFIIANGQTQTLGSATSTFLNQAGGSVLVTAGTLNVDVGSWNNAGSITNAAGAVLTRTATAGVMTNSGVIVNLGSIGVQVWNSGNITNSGGTFVLSVTNSTGGTILSSGGSFTGSTFANLGGTVKATNSLVTINSTTALNSGTLIGGTVPGATLQITNLTQNFVNQGIMLLDSPAGVTNLAFDIRRTGGSGDFTNDVSGLIQGAGFLKTGDFTPGGQNFTEWNKGSIVATNGALIVQPADAFGNGGFVNMAGATVTVASASTFGIQRSDNAWISSGTVPRNEGTIQLNGGTLAFYGNGLNLANDRSLSNAPTGRLLGNGTIEAGVMNFGTINLNNTGTLYVDNSKAATGANVWGIQNGGTIVINTNNTLVLNRLAADWAANEGLNNSGTIRFNGGVYQSAVAGTINNQSTNFLSAAGTGGVYGNGTFDSALDAQAGTLSAENGTLNFTRAVINNIGNGVTAQAIGSGNVLQFFGGASLSASSALIANSGGEVRFVGATNSTVAGAFNNTGGFLTITGASTVFFTNTLARANLGTITVAGAGNLNYGGIGDLFTNTATGTIRSTSPNGGTITGILGANDYGLINQGTLIAGAGSTLTIDPRDATAIGLSNAASGHIIVEDSAASFIVTRTTTGWGGDILKNEGTITINGGTFATFNNGGSAPTTTRVLQNDGLIEGSGFFSAALTNYGTLNVNGGTLTVARLENEIGGVIDINTGSTLTNTDLTAPGWRNFGTVNVNNGTLSGNGTFENRGTINVSNTGTLLASGQFRNFGDIIGQNANVNFVSVTNNSTGFMLVSNSVLNVTGALRNIGSLTVFNGTANLNQVFNNSGALMTISNSSASPAGLNVSGIFTNSGRIQFYRSVGTFANGAVNSGTWVTDPTTNIFQNTYTVTAAGAVQMTAGDVFIFSNNATTAASFVNLSTNNTQNDMLGGKFLFDSTLALTQNLYTAGHDFNQADATTPTNQITVASLSPLPDGYFTNFALGTLEIANSSTVDVWDAFSGDPGLGTNDDLRAALYVTNLVMGADSDLIINSNVSVYFLTSNTWTAANFTLLGGPILGEEGQLHQFISSEVLSVVPEPGVSLLWLCGFVTVYAARRRARKSNRS